MKRLMLPIIPAVLALAACSASAPPVTKAPTRMNFAAHTAMPALPPVKRFSAKRAAAPMRSNAEIARDFIDLSFAMENGRKLRGLTRFEGPISVRLTGAATTDMHRDLQQLLARLRAEAGLNISQTKAAQANITIQAIPSATLQRAVPNASCFVVPNVSTISEYIAARYSAKVDWTHVTQRTRAAIFVPSDAAPQEIRDCLHEELAQALGPLNDLYRLPDSVFNDDNIHSVLTGFDMLILRAYYAPELTNGMSRAQVAAKLPGVLARLNPRGQGGGARISSKSLSLWDRTMHTVMSNTAPATRRGAAERAVGLSGHFGGADARAGFAHYAYGRLHMKNNPQRAYAALVKADQMFSRSSATRIHRAHVAAQLAGYALRSGDSGRAIALTQQAIPVARAHENAALLATLKMVRSEALKLQGNDAAARAERLDSLGWARYGFGADRNVWAKAQEIARLNPAR